MQLPKPPNVKRLLVTVCAVVLLLPMLLSGKVVIPVKDATFKDWNRNSFWHYPWGKSGVHKGIDIFAPIGTPALAACGGVVVGKGYNAMGGNWALIVGAKYRLYYYAHLQETAVTLGQVVQKSTMVGKVGDTGNAAGKQPHLHFSVLSLLPHITKWDNEPQGWKKMFYLNPHELISKSVTTLPVRRHNRSSVSG